MTRLGKWMLGSVLAVATAVAPGVGLAHRDAPPAAAPRLTLSVSISGGTDIQPNTQCYWWANVQGGTPPYTYSWSGGTALSGANALEYSAQSASSFTVSVGVKDATNQRASASYYVIVDSSARECPY